MTTRAKIWLIVCIVLFVPISIFLWSIGRGLRTTEQIANRTFDGDNVIYNYEWFKQTYEDIKALDRKITNAEDRVGQFKETAGDPKDWGYSLSEEFNRLNGICLGLKNQRADVIAKYNARSKMVNRNIFKGKDLPITIEIE